MVIKNYSVPLRKLNTQLQLNQTVTRTGGVAIIFFVGDGATFQTWGFELFLSY